MQYNFNSKEIDMDNESLGNVKKRGRPAGYRKMPDGTWVKLQTGISPESNANTVTSNTDGASKGPKKRGRPAGYRKMPDGTWVKQDVASLNTPKTIQESITEDPTDDQIDTLVESMDKKECPQANVFNFVTVVSDPTLRGIDDKHFSHDIFKVFHDKGIKEFYIDDPYNSLGTEDFADLYDWMDMEGYLSSTLTRGNKRKFTAVFKNNEPYFILFSTLSGSDGEYNANLAGLPIMDKSTGKPLKFKTKTGLWGLFPCKHLDSLDNSARSNITAFKCNPTGFYYDIESFPGTNFEVYFNGIVVEIGTDGLTTPFSIALDMLDSKECEPTIIRNEAASVSSEETVDEDDSEDQDDAEDYDDSATGELNFESYKPKKLSNDFLLDDDGIYRRKYKDAYGDYISSNRADIFYSDSNLEKEHYASLGDGAYRSRNHQLSDFIDYDEMD